MKLHSQEGVDLLPCDIMLSGTEMALMSSMCRESHLKRYIEFVQDGYDYILIDCLPTLGILVQNALTAATEVLIPTQAQFLSTKGLTQLLHTISQVRRGLNPNLTLDGILGWNIDLRAVQRITFGNENLRSNNIDACNHLGNGMFNLDTRVHLNEVWIAFLVHKEFKCTGISVADLLAKLDSAVENNLTC